jgi:hypothetical protein
MLIIGCSLNAMEAAAFRNEPDGFKDMRWGIQVGTLFTKDDSVGFSSDDKSFKYQRISDTTALEIDGVTLYGMVFSFYSGMFWKVEVEARLLQAANLLKTFSEKYGEPTRVTHISEFSREYVWSGNTTDIRLVESLNYYDRKTPDIAIASIYNRKIKSSIETDSDRAQADRKLPIDTVDGFRGRKWGSGFNKNVVYSPLEQEPYFVYLIKGDDMEFEGVSARQIRYQFYENKALQKVELHFSGKQNYLKLKEACFKRFGYTSRFEQGEIRWIGKKTTASLLFTIDANGVWLSKLIFWGFGTQ